MSKESALHNNGWFTESKLTDNKLSNAMDEYAEEVAVDFAKWYMNNEVIEFIKGRPFQTLIPVPTIEQLFKKYKQEKLCNP